MLRKFFRIVLPCLMSLMVLASASSINAFAVEKNDLDIQDIIESILKGQSLSKYIQTTTGYLS